MINGITAIIRLPDGSVFVPYEADQGKFDTITNKAGTGVFTATYGEALQSAFYNGVAGQMGIGATQDYTFAVDTILNSLGVATGNGLVIRVEGIVFSSIDTCCYLEVVHRRTTAGVWNSNTTQLLGSLPTGWSMTASGTNTDADIRVQSTIDSYCSLTFNCWVR